MIDLAPTYIRAGAWCGLGAAALALFAPWIAGANAPGYSHLAQYISELGAVGMPHATLVNLGGFMAKRASASRCSRPGNGRTVQVAARQTLYAS